MKFITGEDFQSLCGTQISIEPFTPYELKSDIVINAWDYDFTDYDNSELVYVNIDLIKGPIKPENLNEESKNTLVFDKEVNIVDSLKKFKNPFRLVLHNNDAGFDESNLELLDIPNCKKIYTQNVLIEHEDVVPIPIGLGNSCWHYGDQTAFDNIEPSEEKTEDIFFNFTIEGGCRDVKRPDCFNKCTQLGIPWIKSLDQRSYIEKLNTYKFIISPEGNGIDCHRTWEALYLKTIPIVDKNKVTEHFSKLFPMVLVDDWNTFKLDDLNGVYEKADWSNYELLDFNKFISYIGIIWQ